MPAGIAGMQHGAPATGERLPSPRIASSSAKSQFPAASRVTPAGRNTA